ncbi:MAG: hypothetical protein PHI48_02230 [Bacteroidales bacterium]|nr:hypothetical protein [Bacteroidales bacterium]MDD4821366.1 hypothetical protein [Bacteroidales bacterium]
MKSIISQIQSFNFHRVISLILEYYHRNKKTLFISSIALFLFLFCTLLLFKRYGEIGRQNDILQYSLQIGCIYLISSILAVHYFSTLWMKPGNISALSLPCNAIERLLSAVIVTMIAFPVAYSLISLASYFSTLPFFRSHDLRFFNLDPIGMGWISIIGTFIGTPVLFLWGGLFFKRSPWIKTILASIVYSAVCVAITVAIFYFLDPNWDAFSEWEAFNEFFIPKGSEYVNGKMATIYHSPFYFLSSISLMTCMVIATYYLLKEKEVK